MDLRGLTPEDVYQLMGSGLNKQQLDMMDQYRKEQLTQEAAQNRFAQEQARIMNKFRESDDQRQMLKLQMEAGEVKPDSPVNVNGKMVQRYHDKFGNVVRQEILGDAPQVDKGTKLLKDGDGNPYWAKPGDPLRPGSTYLASQDNGFSIKDQYTLSFLKSEIETGLDKDGNEIDEATRDNNMTLVNLNDKSDQFVKIPGKEVPGMFNRDIPPQYIKIPKQAAKIAALPGSKIIYYDEASGKALTVDAVKQIAKDKGYSIEEFLKISGIAK